MRVVSYNIRCSTAPDGNNDWHHRKQLFIESVRKLHPDLMGMQEVTPEQQDDLVAALTDYGTVGVARDDGKREGEFSCIYYRKDRFTLRDSGTFWLSDHPDKVGEKGWDAVCVRICTYAILVDNKTSKEFLAANTHFDHKGKVAVLKSAELLRDKLPQLAGDRPIVLTGDFNSHEDDANYALLTKPTDPKARVMSDTYREIHPKRERDEASFHGFHGTVEGSRIDWILHTAELTCTAAEIDHEHSADGEYPSDHYAVWADLKWNEKR